MIKCGKKYVIRVISSVQPHLLFGGGAQGNALLLSMCTDIITHLVSVQLGSGA